MNAKRNKLSLSVCALMTAASLCLSACTSSNTQKIVQANAFGPIVLKTSEYQAAYDDAGDEQKYKALILLLELISSIITSMQLNRILPNLKF